MGKRMDALRRQHGDALRNGETAKAGKLASMIGDVEESASRLRRARELGVSPLDLFFRDRDS